MGLLKAEVTDHQIITAKVSLTLEQEQSHRQLGLAIPDPVTVTLLVDTGSKRTSLVPGIIRHLDPIKQSNVRVESSTGSVQSSLYWVSLAFPGSNLKPIEHLSIASLPLPVTLANYHGLIGRDLLLAWEYFFLEGRRRRITIRDTRRLLLDWLRLP
jgi:hypothetical protein